MEGLKEEIGGYVLVRFTGDNGLLGWGEVPVIKDWGGDYGRYYGETPGTTKYIIETYLTPALAGAEAWNFAGLHHRMDAAI